MEEIFTEIYRTKKWGGLDSFSGPGASLAQTAVIREQLPRLVKELGVRTLLDIPCGDLYWMKEVKLELDLYIGADIVGELIAANIQTFSGAADRHREFLKLDMTNDALPQVDLILCRDGLVHLPFNEIFRAVEKIKSSHSKYLLMTTFIGAAREAVDIPTGRWRPLNFQRPPFNFPEALKIIVEGCTENDGLYPDKSLALWRVAALPSFHY